MSAHYIGQKAEVTHGRHNRVLWDSNFGESISICYRANSTAFTLIRGSEMSQGQGRTIDGQYIACDTGYMMRQQNTSAGVENHGLVVVNEVSKQHTNQY